LSPFGSLLKKEIKKGQIAILALLSLFSSQRSLFSQALFSSALAYLNTSQTVCQALFSTIFIVYFVLICGLFGSPSVRCLTNIPQSVPVCQAQILEICDFLFQDRGGRHTFA